MPGPCRFEGMILSRHSLLPLLPSWDRQRCASVDLWSRSRLSAGSCGLYPQWSQIPAPPNTRAPMAVLKTRLEKRLREAGAWRGTGQTTPSASAGRCAGAKMVVGVNAPYAGLVLWTDVCSLGGRLGDGEN
jgi:hypothetical protein